MFLSNTNIAVLLAACSLISATPIVENPSKTSQVKRDEPSAYPYGDALLNEFKWLGWDPANDADKADGQKIHEGLRQWQDVARGAVDAASGGTSNVHFRRWFGSPEADDLEAVQGVFSNMFNNGATGNVASLVLERADFGNECGDRRFAYMQPDTGHFHICRLNDLKLNSEIGCGDFTKPYIDSNPARTVPFTILHEFTHADSIAGLRFTILDPAVSSRQCFALDDEDKLENANNYAFFAAEVYWSGVCPDKTFEDPPPLAQSSATLVPSSATQQPSTLIPVSATQQPPTLVPSSVLAQPTNTGEVPPTP